MRASSSIMAAALGAACMYWLDPTVGRRRRARARGRLDHAVHASVRGFDLASRDLWHRLHGAAAAWRTQERPDDDVLAEHVRAALGRLSSHPRALQVKCQAGRVMLAGPTLAREAGPIIAKARAVPGVVAVEDRLERHELGDVPALQGAARRPEGRMFPAYWPPSARLLAGTAGAGLVGYGVLRGGIAGAATGLAGTAVLARSISNVDLGSLFGVGPRRGGIGISKTMTIHAPVEAVFAYFTAFENFPRFMRHVLDVKKVDDNCWHWRVRGPAGTSFEWDGLVMGLMPNKFVSWSTADSASVRHSGSAVFERGPGITRLTIRMNYEPPLGYLGHQIAKLFGADPKREIDEDLVRFKSLVEQGKTTGPHGTLTREDVAVLPPGA